MINNKKQLEFGYIGLALLRNRLVGKDSRILQIFEDLKKLSKSLAEDDLDLIEKEVKKYDEGWIQELTKLPISSAIADILIKGDKQ